MLKNLIVSAVVLGLAGCVNTATGDPLYDALVGKTWEREDGNVTMIASADGALTGTTSAGDLLGTWEIRNGEFCRTLSSPERAAGSACQEMELTDDGIKIAGFNYTQQ